MEQAKEQTKELTMEQTAEQAAAQAMATEEIRETLASMHDLNVQQLQVMKKQLKIVRLTSVILAVALVAVLVFAGTSFTRINKALDDFQAAAGNLADADWPEMIDNINELVSTSQEGINSATKKIESIDIDALNKSIHDLNTIISPLARLFGGQ